MSNQVDLEAGFNNETVNESGVVMDAQNVKEFTKEEIREELRRFNEAQGLSPSDEAYIKLSGSKSDLVKRFGSIVGEFEIGTADKPEETGSASDVDESVEIDSASITERKHLVLKWGQIKRNPLNPRHEEDYYDNTLIRLIAKDKGITDALVVRPTGEVDENGDEIYYPVSGNRRHANLGFAIERQQQLVEQGVIDEFFYVGEVEDFPVDVMLRETEGNESATLFDELKILVNLNESSWPLSPVDKYHAMSNMLAIKGVTQQDVADALDVTKQYVSKMQAFSEVPEFILDYVHYGHNAERFASTRTPEELKSAGIPFIELDEPDEEGRTVKVLGITTNNALEIASTLRRAIRSSEDDEDEVREAFNAFLVNSTKEWMYRAERGEGVLTAAIAMSQNQFKQFLQEAAEDFGLFSKTEEVEEETKTLETSTEEVSEEDEVEVAAETAEDIEPIADQFEELAVEIEAGKYRLNSDVNWQRKLADDLRFGSEEAEAAFNWMVDAKLIS